MGPKLVNGCRLEQMGTKEFGKMMNRIQTQEGRVPVKDAKIGESREKGKEIREGCCEALPRHHLRLQEGKEAQAPDLGCSCCELVIRVPTQRQSLLI